MPADRALLAAGDSAPRAVRSRLEQAAGLVRRGMSVSDAAARTGLLDTLDAAVLSAAARAGSMEVACRRLAEHHARADARLRQLRSRLWLPVAVLVLAVLVRPLPDLVAGSLDSSGYLGAAIGPLLVIASVVLLAARAWTAFRGSKFRQMLDALVARAPVAGPLVIRHSRVAYLESLSMLAGAGVPLLPALEQAARATPNRAVAREFMRLHDRVASGSTLHQAFAACPLMQPASVRLLQAGEAAGKLDDILERMASREREELEAWRDAVATWVPRVAYLLVAAWIASGLVGASVGSRVPTGL